MSCWCDDAFDSCNLTEFNSEGDVGIDVVMRETKGIDDSTAICWCNEHVEDQENKSAKYRVQLS